MKFRAIDKNNDWTFGQGLQNYRNNAKAIELDIKTALQEWKTDCFFNQNAGLDMDFFREKNTQLKLDENIKTVVLGRQGVTGIRTYNSNLIDRDYFINMQVISLYGSIFLEGFEVNL